VAIFPSLRLLEGTVPSLIDILSNEPFLGFHAGWIECGVAGLWLLGMLEAVFTTTIMPIEAGDTFRRIIMTDCASGIWGFCHWHSPTINNDLGFPWNFTAEAR
jgi:hypothetical protein